MLNIDTYLASLLSALENVFGPRLVYAGLQGGYCRGEADGNSDIDIMLVLDDIQPEDLDIYRSIIGSLGDSDKACGFICGKAELSSWNRLEVCQLTHETKSLYGDLKPLMPEYTPGDVMNYVKLKAGDLYHELCHRYIYTNRENSCAKLPGCYKQAFYILQNLNYIKTGEYILTKRELLTRLNGLDYEVLYTAIAMKAGEGFDFGAAYSLIFNWCKKVIGLAPLQGELSRSD